MSHQSANEVAERQAQNIYDVDVFFDQYKKLDRQTMGLDGAPEWPRLRLMLPSLAGAQVLDLGCGMGWFARWAIEHGAAHVRGIDLSENMLVKARNATTTDAIVYERADLNHLTLPREKYDVVYSSLAFHYLHHLETLIGEIQQSLKQGGKLVFTVEHPIFLGPTAGGFIPSPDGQMIWPLDAYHKEGERLRNWFVTGVRKQHRTMETYINMLLNAGFQLTDFAEWCPSKRELEKHPSWGVELARPMFLLIGATKMG